MKNPSLFWPRRSRGFTIMELLVVIAIILVLVTMVVSGVGWYKRKAAEGKTKVLVATIERALEEYKTDSGVYPLGDGSESSTAEVYRLLYGDPDGDGNSNAGETVYLSTLDPNLPLKTRVVDTEGTDYVIIDAWFQPLRYRHEDPVTAAQMNPDFDLWSLGIDLEGHPDGDEESKKDDVTNWK